MGCRVGLCTLGKGALRPLAINVGDPDVVPIYLRAHPVLLDEFPFSETNDSDIGISGLRRPLGYLGKLPKTILTANVN